MLTIELLSFGVKELSNQHINLRYLKPIPSVKAAIEILIYRRCTF